MVALNWGEHKVDAGTAAMLVNIGPILIVLLGSWLLGEGLPMFLGQTPAWPSFAGGAACLAGVAVTRRKGRAAWRPRPAARPFRSTRSTSNLRPATTTRLWLRIGVLFDDNANFVRNTEGTITRIVGNGAAPELIKLGQPQICWNIRSHM